MRSSSLRSWSCSAAALAVMLTGCTDAGQDQALNPPLDASAPQSAPGVSVGPPEDTRLGLGDSAASDLQQKASPMPSRRDAETLLTHGSD